MPDALLPSVRFVVAEDLKELRTAVDGLPGEALDWKPAGDNTNSIAVLVTHVLHSTRSWLSVALAAPLPDRDRDSEFRVHASDTAALLALIDDFTSRIDAILGSGQEVDWAANRKAHARPDPSLPDYVPAAWAALHAIEHLREHIAHISLTRQLWDARMSSK